MSYAKTPAPQLTAADLLNSHDSQLVKAIKSDRRVYGELDIWIATDTESLSKSQRDELGSRLRAAGKTASPSPPIDIDELHLRLKNTGGGRDSPSEPGCLRSSRESSESTVPPDPDHGSLREQLSYDELLQDGGRPVCAIKDLSYAQQELAASHESILPWLSDSESTNRNGEIQPVFSRQLDRWWDFRKWQLDNRGSVNGDGAFSAFLAAERRMYDRTQVKASDSSLKETMLCLWQQKPRLRLLSEDHEFPAYREAVKRRLAPHNFNRPLQLEKDPHEQTEWSTWLEYLHFEQWWLERNTAAAAAGERQYHEACRRLFKAVSSWRQGGSESHCTQGNYDSPSSVCAAATSGTSRIRQPRQNKRTDVLAKQLASAEDAHHKAMKVIEKYTQDTASYRRAERAIYRQKHRVQWVLKETRDMEAEATLQRETAKNESRSDVGGSKKRRCSDDDDDAVDISESRFKRKRR